MLRCVGFAPCHVAVDPRRPPATPVAMPDLLPNPAARRLFLHRHALAEAPTGPATGADLARLIDRIGFVQVDSINTVERAHHMILWSRRQSYRPAALKPLLERDRSLWEHWTHDASILPVHLHPLWQHRFARDAERLHKNWKSWFRDGYEAQFDTILRRIEADGPVTSTDVGQGETRGKGGWWDWHPSKTALEWLWRTGQLAISRRDGFQKVYDLTDRVIPTAHRLPAPDPETLIDWACSSALDNLGFADASELAGLLARADPCRSESMGETRPCPGRNHRDRPRSRRWPPQTQLCPPRRADPSRHGPRTAPPHADTVALRPSPARPRPRRIPVRLPLSHRSLRTRTPAQIRLLRLSGAGVRPPDRPHRRQSLPRYQHLARQSLLARTRRPTDTAAPKETGSRTPPPRQLRRLRSGRVPRRLAPPRQRCVTSTHLAVLAVVPAVDHIQRLFCRLDDLEQLQICFGNHARLGQHVPVDHLVPPLPSEQHERDFLHPARLHQGQAFEHLIHRAKAARKDADRPRPHQEVHLADREVVKVEGQIRRDIGVRRLFMRQHDVQPDGLAACIRRPAVARLHHPRSATRHNDILAAIALQAAFCHCFGKAPGLVVIAGQFSQHRGVGRCLVCRIGDARATEQHHG